MLHRALVPRLVSLDRTSDEQNTIGVTTTIVATTTNMRRTELEQRLRKLGWIPTGQASGIRHERWAHPRRRSTIAVPTEDLIINAVAAAILAEAGE